MVSKTTVDNFLKAESIAVYGVSRTGKKFGNFAYRDLRKKGFKVYPIHPEADEVEGDRCFRQIKDIGEEVGAALIVLPASQTESVLPELASAGVRTVWIQQGAGSEKAIQICETNGLDAVHGECILMYAKPSGFHKVHRWLWKVLGKLPSDK